MLRAVSYLRLKTCLPLRLALVGSVMQPRGGQQIALLQFTNRGELQPDTEIAFQAWHLTLSS